MPLMVLRLNKGKQVTTINDIEVNEVVSEVSSS